ncbi:MAG: hypothetical protein M5U09_15250 [Gammaproteobacteria bacterium]|nr:hypothetical protein [Gammaproteobacteria bacterium]
MYHKNKLESLYDLVTGDEDTRVCKDIPSAACNDQPRNFFAYLAANVLNKVADEVTSARLVLPWLMGALGVPAAFAGFLVPIREAGVLLPQLLVAAWVRGRAMRKPVWMTGARLSSAALALMAVTALSLSGAAAGWALIGALTLFSPGAGHLLGGRQGCARQDGFQEPAGQPDGAGHRHRGHCHPRDRARPGHRARRRRGRGP